MNYRAIEFFLLIVSSSLITSILLSGEGRFEPQAGMTSNIPSVGAPTRTFNLFIPTTYFKYPEQKFPVLFVSSPSGNPNLKPYTDWAERQGVIVVGLNSSRNGPTDNNIEAQETTLRTIEPALRLHPCLRFGVGFSGGAQASWVLATRHADRFAGILMLGQSGFGNLPPKHIAVAYIYGEQEPNRQSIEDACQRLKRNGNPLKQLVISGGHVAGSTEQQTALLDWMLELARLSHPKLPPAEIAAARKVIIDRLNQAEKQSDTTVSKNELERLLSLPGVANWPESKPFFIPWLNAVFAASSMLSSDLEKYFSLSEALDNPWSLQADRATRNTIEKKIDELRQNPQIRSEYEADLAFKQCVYMEQQAVARKPQLQLVRQAYEALQQRYPDCWCWYICSQ